MKDLPVYKQVVRVLAYISVFASIWVALYDTDVNWTFVLLNFVLLLVVNLATMELPKKSEKDDGQQ